MSSDTRTPVQDASPKETDELQHLFLRPFFLSWTIGIPFCIFKLVFGAAVLREGAGGPLQWAGLLILCWAVSDLCLNVGRNVLDVLHRPATFEYCTLAQLGAFFKLPLVFLAIDTLVTFTIICTMLWTGWIARLTPTETTLWYAATTMNLISLSVVSLYNELRRNRTL
jgi:hypothetical protein